MPFWNGSTGGASPAQVETACAAAIASANLATAAAVAALPDAADVETACDAAIASAGLATSADLDAKFPDLLVAEVTGVAGAASAEVVAASPGQQIAVYGWFINSQNAIGGGIVSWFSGDVMTGSSVREGAVGTGGQWIQEPLSDVVFTTVTGEELTVANDGVDAITARVYYLLVTP
jgi:hypothetical protein